MNVSVSDYDDEVTKKENEGVANIGNRCIVVLKCSGGFKRGRMGRTPPLSPPKKRKL